MSVQVHLSLVGPCAAVEMEEAVAVGAQISTSVTQNDGCRLPVIMVITHGLRIKRQSEEVKRRTKCTIALIVLYSTLEAY